MAKIKIDGMDLETGTAKTILDVTRANGIPVPTFCYNPELSIAANCRMCLVEVKGAPKLLPACQTDVREGMEILTASPRVKAWQQQNLEYILLNHPVDCPICDQAGECGLQRHYWKYDAQPARIWSFKDKERKAKRVILGPHVVYDAERCILCTQCIRFCAEVWGGHVLDSRERGDRREIIVAKGESLDFPYSLMVAQVCPVGAMTSRDFRFAKRVWLLESGDTICPGCATGCAATLDHEGGVAYRLRPRRDDTVNRCWLCDEGVLSGSLHDERVARPALGRGEGRRETSLDEAVSAAAAILRESGGATAVVLSAMHSTEDNVLVAAFAAEALRSDSLYLAARADGEADKLLRSADKNPNRKGAAGAGRHRAAPVGEIAPSGARAAILSLGGTGPGDLPETVKVVAITSARGPLEARADVVIPVPSFAQAAGSYVNAKGMRRSFGIAMGGAKSGDPAPAGVAAVLDRLASAMGLAWRARDPGSEVDRIAADAGWKEG